ncbi:MAG: hypothetical protein H0X35_14135, partial [Pseudonocardiales bacterium]|nr:hypothetical protein [Pseudonocardiales bacterium]
MPRERDAVTTAATPDVALEAALEAWHDNAAVGAGARRPGRAATLTAHTLA